MHSLLVDALENDNALKIFSVLQKSERPLGATRIAKQSGVARSTVYHQLGKLIEQDLVKPVPVAPGSTRKRYAVTVDGRKVDASQTSQALKEMISYFHYLQVPENIIWQITVLLKPKIKAFLALPQNPELYMALFYVYYNLTTTTDLRLDRKEFSRIFHIKHLALNYYLDKIVNGDLGFYHFEHMGEDFFFHEADELGAVLQQRLATFFEREELRRQLGDEEEPLPLQEFIEQTAADLTTRGYVRVELQKPFTLFLWDYTGTYCIEHGIAGDLLPEIPDAADTRAPSIVEDIRGYCARCGNWVFHGTARCERCFTRVQAMDVISDCVKAVHLAQEYDYLMRDRPTTCPHCDHRFPAAWELVSCPRCGESLSEFEPPAGDSSPSLESTEPGS